MFVPEFELTSGKKDGQADHAISSAQGTYMKNYVLNPYLRLSQYANRYFTYDARVASNPLIEIPTRGITEQDYNTFRKLKTDGFFLEPRSETEIVNFFSRENLAVALFSSMLRQNLLKPYTSPGESVEKKVLDFFKTRYARQEPALPVSPQTPFEENDENLHMFSPRTFFNLPRDIDPRECHVGILGVPHASMDVSLGTEAAPVQFRLHSRSLCWFEIFQQGVYSEIAFEAGRPSVLCKDIVVRDCGDLDFQDLTLSQNPHAKFSRTRDLSFNSRWRPRNHLSHHQELRGGCTRFRPFAPRRA